MSRTGLDAQAIAKGMRDFARLVSKACEQQPWQTNALLDAADMLDENAKLRELVDGLQFCGMTESASSDDCIGCPLLEQLPHSYRCTRNDRMRELEVEVSTWDT